MLRSWDIHEILRYIDHSWGNQGIQSRKRHTCLRSHVLCKSKFHFRYKNCPKLLLHCIHILRFFKQVRNENRTLMGYFYYLGIGENRKIRQRIDHICRQQCVLCRYIFHWYRHNFGPRNHQDCSHTLNLKIELKLVEYTNSYSSIPLGSGKS